MKRRGPNDALRPGDGGSSKLGAEGECRTLADFVRDTGGRFSAELGIDVESGESSEIFKWFLAAILFGARISGRIAANAYREFAKKRLLSPDKILQCGWTGLIRVLDRGGYARYDFKTASKLLAICTALLDTYAGDLNKMHVAAENARDLEERVKALGEGIGEVTAGIFLREMRGAWPKAQPLPSDLVLVGAKDLGLLKEDCSSKTRALSDLKATWAREGGRSPQFPAFEAALLRHGLAVRRRRAPKRSTTERRAMNSANHKIRAFIGFQLNVEVVRALAEFIGGLKACAPDEGVAWVEPHNVHVTLRFLGDAVDLHMIAPLAEQLKAAASETPPFGIRVQDLGAFPSPQRPRTLWVGIVSAELQELAARVDRAAIRCGFQSEQRPFTPHITIARIRRIRHWKAIRSKLGELPSLDFGSSIVDHVSIYRSFKEADARIYEEIASFLLVCARQPNSDRGSV